MLSWALPLTITVLGYGLAAGLWKSASLTPAAFCVLFALMKTPTNWVAWGLSGRPNPFAAPRFLRWAALGQFLNGFAWILYFKAMSAGPVAIVQTITAAYTALAAILALVFLRERIVWVQMIGIAMGVPSLREVFDERYYTDLEGGILESLGRLFKNDLKLYVYPVQDKTTGALITAGNLMVAPHLRHLYAYLIENRLIEGLRDVDERCLPIFSRSVKRLIPSNRAA